MTDTLLVDAQGYVSIYPSQPMTDLTFIAARVRHMNGAPVTGLEASNFKVSEMVGPSGVGNLINVANPQGPPGFYLMNLKSEKLSYHRNSMCGQFVFLLEVTSAQLDPKHKTVDHGRVLISIVVPQFTKVLPTDIVGAS
jgi:hypothetical protein